MIIVRIIGWVLLLAGLIVLGRDFLGWRDAGVWAPISLEQLWLELGRASLARFEGALAPWLLGIVHGALALWAAPTILVPGIILAWLGRKRGEPRRRRRR
jgi:hypothetical protein